MIFHTTLQYREDIHEKLGFLDFCEDDWQMKAKKSSLENFAQKNRLSICILRIELNSDGHYEVIPFHSINLGLAKKKQDLIYLAAVKRSSAQFIPGRGVM